MYVCDPSLSFVSRESESPRSLSPHLPSRLNHPTLYQFTSTNKGMFASKYV